MNENNWKPTEEELVSLGFEKRFDEDYGTFHVKTLVEYLSNIQFHPKRNDFAIKETSGRWVYAYPKSLEELRSLISMMKP